MITRILNFFKRKKSMDGLIGYWGVWDTENDESKVQGEMYSYEGRWIPGPKLYDDKELK